MQIYLIYNILSDKVCYGIIIKENSNLSNKNH